MFMALATLIAVKCLSATYPVLASVSEVIRAHGQVTYVLLTRSPLDSEKQAFLPLVRLACIRHAASVHPEPGSNSPFDLALRCL